MDCIRLLSKTYLILLMISTKGYAEQESSEPCFVDTAEFEISDGVFKVHHFEVEEGILLVTKKLVGTVIMSGKQSHTFTFDEPSFTTFRHQKVPSQPKYFEIIFKDIYPYPVIGPTTAAVPPMTTLSTIMPTENSSLTTTDVKLLGEETLGSGNDQFITNTESFLTLGTTTLFAERNHTSFVTQHTENSSVQCVKAYLYQIYDLDREEQDTHYLTINNLADEDLSIPTLLVIKVSDINDNSPILEESSLSTIVPNNIPAGVIVAQIKAKDADIGINADLRYEILFQTERRGNATGSPILPSVIIHRTTGNVVLIQSIRDLTPPSRIIFSVVVKDNGEGHVCNRATATASILISDVTSTSTTEIYFNTTETSTAVKSSVGASGIVGIAVGSSAAGIVMIALIILLIRRFIRRRLQHRNDGALEFMLDDDTLLSA